MLKANRAHPKFNDVSGAIDRIFRTIEMFGITALVGVLVAEYGDQAIKSVMVFGTTMAMIYLTEPIINWIGYLILGEDRNGLRIVGAIASMFIWVALIDTIAPYLSAIPKRITNTISMNASPN